MSGIECLEGDLVRELEDGLCLHIYDIPYPPKRGDRKTAPREGARLHR